MTNPCYDKRTNTDCPDRKAGCASSCPKWQEYEKIRNEGYKAKAKAFASESFNETSLDRKIKYNLRTRANPRKHGNKE